MNARNHKIPIRGIISLLFIVVIYLFWAIPFRSMLSYQEQMQLFLNDTDYFVQHLTWPGGFSTWLGEFMTQFNNNYWIGAAVVALMLLGVQWLTWAIIRRSGNTSASSYAMSYLPVIALLVYMGDYAMMPSFVVATLMSLLFALAFTNINGTIGRWIYALLSIPLFYWLFGPLSITLSLLYFLERKLPACAVKDGELPTHHSSSHHLSFLLLLPYTLLVVYTMSGLVSYPLAQQFIGINYYRLPLTFTAMQCVVMVTPVIVVALTVLTRPMVRWALFAVSVAAGIYGMLTFYDSKEQTVIQYDYLVRTGNWQAIIDKSTKQQPDMPITVAATNLALGMTNQLGDRAFEFFQNGTEGLVPPFQMETFSSLTNSEIYFQLGMINTAQRMCFEGMEAIPNYNKSVRCIKRLAETAIIRGDYRVAEKYLRLLEKTLFYKKWAQRNMALIDSPQSITQHPLYGRLRAQQIDDEFLFSETEVDKMLGQLFVTNPGNSLAMQYLIIYPLLQRDIDKFLQYMQVVIDRVRYNPLVAQQAVAYASGLSGRDVPPGTVSAPVLNNFRDFVQVWNQSGNSPQLERFRGTLWLYLSR